VRWCGRDSSDTGYGPVAEHKHGILGPVTETYYNMKTFRADTPVSII